MNKAQAVSKPDGKKIFWAAAGFAGLAASWLLISVANNAAADLAGNYFRVGIVAALLVVAGAVVGIVKVRGVLLVLPIVCLVLALITIVYLSFWVGMNAFFEALSSPN